MEIKSKTKENNFPFLRNHGANFENMQCQPWGCTISPFGKEDQDGVYTEHICLFQSPTVETPVYLECSRVSDVSAPEVLPASPASECGQVTEVQ